MLAPANAFSKSSPQMLSLLSLKRGFGLCYFLAWICFAAIPTINLYWRSLLLIFPIRLDSLAWDHKLNFVGFACDRRDWVYYSLVVATRCGDPTWLDVVHAGALPGSACRVISDAFTRSTRFTTTCWNAERPSILFSILRSWSPSSLSIGLGRELTSFLLYKWDMLRKKNNDT